MVFPVRVQSVPVQRDDRALVVDVGGGDRR